MKKTDGKKFLRSTNKFQVNEVMRKASFVSVGLILRTDKF